MNKPKEDLLLHPTRLRVILSVAGRRVTAHELARELPDVPQASLYRNLRTLVSAGILDVVEERRVRNTTERTYALPNTNLLLTAEELQTATPKNRLRPFTRFLGLLLGYFSRYVHGRSIDTVRDHVMYRMFTLYLSESDVSRLRRGLDEVFAGFSGNSGGQGQRRFVIGIVAMPDAGDATRPTTRANGGTSE